MTTLKGSAIGLAVLFLTGFGTIAVDSQAASDVKQANCSNTVRSTYLLGAEDELQISGPEPDEVPTKVVRVDGEGDIQVPLVGRIHVAGLTVQQAEQEVNKKLAVYVKKPQAALDVKELRSQPASVLGAVNQPGVHQVEGRKTLLEMISLAGGVRPDAGYSIRITRQIEWGCIPLPGATMDASGQFSVAQVKLQDIMEAKVPEENIQIFPHDVISVPKAELIYVTGDVKKSGGFILGEKQNMSVLQAISMAEGLGTAPDTKHAKILRMNPGADQRTEIPVDLKTILQGKGQDVPLQGNDILFVPDSTGRKIALRALEAAIQTGTGVAIYRP
ncbi:MAG: polysaccharide biosynthesis/export family protein [Candidatus Acidiferrum sp.]|jgi:polysaccharide export outer membrane protein